MAATPEAKAKKTVRRMLDDAGCYYIMSVTGGFGRSGAPDITGCHRGRYFGIEVKADTELTELQKHNLQQIKLAGGFPFVVRISSKGFQEGVRELQIFLSGAMFKECM